MKQKKRFIVRKYIMAYSAKNAITLDKRSPVDDVWIDEDWKKSNLNQGKEAIGWAKVRNARPERRAVRNVYKQTLASKRANYKYRTKPEVKDRVKKRRLELRYGITHEKFLELKELQQNMCAICRKKTRS